MDSDGPPGTKEGPQPHGEPLVFNLVTDVGENLPLKSTSPACVRSTVVLNPSIHSLTCLCTRSTVVLNPSIHSLTCLCTRGLAQLTRKAHTLATSSCHKPTAHAAHSPSHTSTHAISIARLHHASSFVQVCTCCGCCCCSTRRPRGDH
jgi:hypothetical protein